MSRVRSRMQKKMYVQFTLLTWKSHVLWKHNYLTLLLSPPLSFFFLYFFSLYFYMRCWFCTIVCLDFFSLYFVGCERLGDANAVIWHSGNTRLTGDSSCPLAWQDVVLDGYVMLILLSNMILKAPSVAWCQQVSLESLVVHQIFVTLFSFFFHCDFEFTGCVPKTSFFYKALDFPRDVYLIVWLPKGCVLDSFDFPRDVYLIVLTSQEMWTK